MPFNAQSNVQQNAAPGANGVPLNLNSFQSHYQQVGKGQGQTSPGAQTAPSQQSPNSPPHGMNYFNQQQNAYHATSFGLPNHAAGPPQQHAP